MPFISEDTTIDDLPRYEKEWVEIVRQWARNNFHGPCVPFYEYLGMTKEEYEFLEETEDLDTLRKYRQYGWEGRQFAVQRCLEEWYTKYSSLRELDIEELLTELGQMCYIQGVADGANRYFYPRLLL